MTVTVLKTEFIKPDPIQINYRDYKKYNSLNFSRDLYNKLQCDVSASSNYDSFQDILGEVLDKHAPIKMIMNRSRCKNKFFKNKSVENWENYKNLEMNVLN